MRVLIAGDDPDVARTIEIALRLDDLVGDVASIGIWELPERSDPADALVIVHDSAVDLDGPALRKARPDARIIVISAGSPALEWADAVIDRTMEPLAALTAALHPGAGTDPKRDRLSVLIHDLRNPIGTLAGFAHLLTEKPEELNPEQLRVIVTGIRRSIERLSRILDDLDKSRRSL